MLTPLLAATLACGVPLPVAAGARTCAEDPRAAEVNARGSAASPDDGARDVLRSLLSRYGGDSALQVLDDLVLHGTGEEHRGAEVQGYHPERQVTVRHEVWMALRPSDGAAAFEHRTGRHDGSERWRRWAVRGDTTLVADRGARSLSVARSPVARREARRLSRIVPHYLLREVLTPEATILSARDSASAGRALRVIRVRLPDESVPVDLVVDTLARELRAMRHLAAFPGIGPAPLDVDYLDPRPTGAFGDFPHRIVIRVDGAVYRWLSVTRIERDAPAASALIAPPEELAGLARPANTFVALAPGVHLLHALGGLYNMLVVEQEDGLFVVETPSRHPSLDRWPVTTDSAVTSLSLEALSLIESRFPGQRIARVMPTHFHSDHAGGLPAFVARGAAVVASVGDTAFYSRYLRRAGTGLAGRFETVARSRAFGRGPTALEVINFARNAHTADNLLVWLPAARIVFQGDLFYLDPGAFPTPGRERITRDFARFLQRRGIAPLRVYGMHGRLYAAPEHLDIARRLPENRQ